ncbi:MAG TPA: hypothetical protein DCR04_11215 [Flavobacteriales bacterium]|nr:hypothetical protein [Flavobacteriales bacterium]
MNGLIDIKKDLKQKEEWISEESPDVCSLDDLIDYAIYGLKRCEDYCGSEDYCGEESCFCVRARMPSPKHYELYEELRAVGQELAWLTILGNFSQDLIPNGIIKKETIK